jgi:hypothetical protein
MTDELEPTEEEIRESQRLREALEDPSKESADADLLRAVQSASNPKTLDRASLDSAVESSLSRRGKPTGGIVIRVAFGAGAVLAAAAAIVFMIGRQPAPLPELAHARSTQSLFKERFETQGGESARIDRIAMARAADLRDNHYARWGVRDRGHR